MNLELQCRCKFITPKHSMDSRNCSVHTAPAYLCDECSCTDYRPLRAPHLLSEGGFSWGRCICGHTAQGHNEHRRAYR